MKPRPPLIKLVDNLGQIPLNLSEPLKDVVLRRAVASINGWGRKLFMKIVSRRYYTDGTFVTNSILGF